MFLEPLEPRQMMTIYPIEGTPFWDYPPNYLPTQTYQAATENFLNPPDTRDAKAVALDYIRQHAGDFGLTAGDLNHFVETDRYVSEESGITNIYLQQTFAGLPIADAVLNASVLPTGQIVSLGASFVPGLNTAAGGIEAPEITKEEAVLAFASAAGITVNLPLSTVSSSGGAAQGSVLRNADISLDPIPVELHYVPKEGGGVDLAWRVIARRPNGQWFDASVAASGARVGQVIRVTDWSYNASYNVFPVPLKDPAEGNRSVVTDPHDLIASPFGWHDTDGIVGPEFLDTQGNNARAQEDLNGDDFGGNRPFGNVGLNFNPPLTIPGPPLPNVNAGILQAFYGTNVAHDVSMHYGFTEAAGNFQTKNYTGKLGGNDAVIVDVQDPIAFNNAFMQVPPEGTPGRMTIGLSSTFNPNRDIALDNVTLFHEYFHGVSVRLTGGPKNSNSLQALQSGGMGEGWSDWFGLLLSLKPTDNRNTPLTVGLYTDGAGGIRRFPYSSDLNVNPLTLDRFNGDPFPQFNNSEVHNSGEIWASALMDMTWNLIGKYGFSTNLYTGQGGNNIALGLVMQALKLQPVNPTFLEARNAILAADRALFGGQNYNEIWSAFAGRGFGQSAVTGRNANSLIVTQSFNMPSPPITVSGTIYNDFDGDRIRDAGETLLAGWTVYNDANNNGTREAGESFTTTGANGTYQLLFFSGQLVRIRQQVQPGWKQIAPESGAHTLFLSGGQAAVGADFANQQLPGSISGIVFNDLDANGTFDAGETRIEGVTVFVDINNDGRISVLEKGAITNSKGEYFIGEVPVGTNHIVRMLPRPGVSQTFPDPLGPDLGVQKPVIVVSGQTTPNVNFGGVFSVDYGDAPTAAQSGFSQSYPTTGANAASHPILPGFGLGTGVGDELVDAELDGQPDATATGDGADENGVVIGGMTPGFPATASVTISTGSNPAGLLQGFIDWNRDGDWNDPGEKIISDLRLSAGTHALTFNVPASVGLGATFARFRYSYDSNLGPTGKAIAGEVEDYRVSVLANTPVANPDNYGAAFGTQLIQQGSTNNRLDVLANDFGISQGSPPVAILPQINLATLPATSTRGGQISVLFDATLNRNVVVYTPQTNTFGIDTFQYQVTAGGIDSNFATVTIDITASDPKALDDSVTFNAALATAAQTIDVLANDIPQTGVTITAVETLTTGVPANTLSASAGGTSLTFTPPAGFRGTVIGRYTIDDLDPLTAPSTARVTVQILNFTNGLPDPTSATVPYLAQLSVEILDVATGQPISMIGDDSEFLVRVSSLDLRAGGSNTTRGVEAAFLDLIFNSAFAQPVLTPGSPLGFNIIFNGQPQAVEASSVQAAPPPTATSFAGGASLSAIDGFYTGKTVTIVGGALNGFQAVVQAYNGATKVFTFAVGALPAAPAAGTQFAILDPPLGPVGTVATAASATSFSGDSSLSSVDDFYVDQNVVFTSGPLVGQSGNVLDYVAATRTFVFAPGAFTAAPVAGNSFRIESELYNFSQRGTANFPAPGQIDEAGGAHFQGANMPQPVGRLTVPVFTVRMRATNPTPAGTPLRFLGDAADPLKDAQGNDTTQDFSKVILFNDVGGSPIELTDEQVFIRSSGPLTIVNGGEGEFTNFVNPLDVTSDGYVSALDALVVINDLNANGSRSLSQISLASSGQLPPQGYLDVNLDSSVTPLDALLIFNHLNGLLASSGAGGEGEAQGEGEAEGESQGVVPSRLLAALVAPPTAGRTATGEASGNPAVLLDTPAAPVAATTAIAAPPSTPSNTLAKRLAKLDSDAADELFASLSDLRQNLRGRLGRRG